MFFFFFCSHRRFSVGDNFVFLHRTLLCLVDVCIFLLFWRRSLSMSFVAIFLSFGLLVLFLWWGIHYLGCWCLVFSWIFRLFSDCFSPFSLLSLLVFLLLVLVLCCCTFFRLSCCLFSYHLLLLSLLFVWPFLFSFIFLSCLLLLFLLYFHSFCPSLLLLPFLSFRPSLLLPSTLVVPLRYVSFLNLRCFLFSLCFFSLCNVVECAHETSNNDFEKLWVVSKGVASKSEM